MTQSTVSRRDSFKTLAAIGAAGAAVAMGTTLAAGPAEAARPQPLMHKALNELSNAYATLANGLHNKGGHRIAAMKLIQQAEEEVNKAIAAGEY